MKAVYESPRMMVQPFVPDEYVAACGDSGIVYNFKCDAGWTEYLFGMPFRVGGTVYVESNNQPGLQTGWGGDTRRTSSYHPCDATHSANRDDEFLDGYLYNRDHGTMDVVIWTDHGTNTHCTTNLDQDSWETAKS